MNYTFNNVLKSKVLLDNTLLRSNNLELTKPTLNRFMSVKLYFKTPQFLDQRQPRVYLSSNTLFYNIFLIYIQYTTLNAHQFFVPHTNFKHLFLFSQYQNNQYLNIPKVYSK